MTLSCISLFFTIRGSFAGRWGLSSNPQVIKYDEQAFFLMNIILHAEGQKDTSSKWKES